MVKQNKRPLLLTVGLLVVVALIYTVSGSNNKVEGITPINLNKKFDQVKLEMPALGTSYDESVIDGEKEIPTDENENEILQNGGLDDSDESGAGSEVNNNGKETADAPLVDNFGEITDTPFMPKMANETLKAQLGNAAWRLFHTILARYPDKPSVQEQTTLSSYIQLFAQVYPCGDCARHFQKLLKEYPPQTRSRKTAALWGCHVHNKVNERLGKPEYDCTTILEDYDCGCGDDEKEIDVTLGGQAINDLKQLEIEEEEEQFGK